jgi:hypothetical protein
VVKTAVFEKDQMASVVCSDKMDQKELRRYVEHGMPLVQVPSSSQVSPSRDQLMQKSIYDDARAIRPVLRTQKLLGEAQWSGLLMLVFPFVALFGLACSIWMSLQPGRGRW